MSRRIQPLCAWCQQRAPVDAHGHSTDLYAMYCAVCLAEHGETIRRRAEWLQAAEALEIERRRQDRAWASTISDPPPDESAHRQRDNQDFIEGIAGGPGDEPGVESETGASGPPACKVAHARWGGKFKKSQ